MQAITVCAAILQKCNTIPQIRPAEQPSIWREIGAVSPNFQGFPGFHEE
jgi:hypothetical protein